MLSPPHRSTHLVGIALESVWQQDHGMALSVCARWTAQGYVVGHGNDHHVVPVIQQPPFDTQKTRGNDELASFRDTSHYCEQLAWHSTRETVLATAVSDKMLRYV